MQMKELMERKSGRGGEIEGERDREGREKNSGDAHLFVY